MYGVSNFSDSHQPDNQYTLTCPVVAREARLTHCLDKRQHHMRGERVHDADCQCVMRAGKCPAMAMLEQEWRSGERMFFDKSATVHRISKHVANRIEKIQVLPSHSDGLHITEQQSKHLFGKVMQPGEKLNPSAYSAVVDEEKPTIQNETKVKRGRPRKS